MLDLAKTLKTYLSGELFSGFSGQSMPGKVCPAYEYPDNAAAIKAIIQAVATCPDEDRLVLAQVLEDSNLEPFGSKVVLSFPELASDRIGYGDDELESIPPKQIVGKIVSIQVRPPIVLELPDDCL